MHGKPTTVAGAGGGSAYRASDVTVVFVDHDRKARHFAYAFGEDELGADRARRIAAALNYCDGVPTEELEACVRDGRPLLVLAAGARTAAAEVRKLKALPRDVAVGSAW